MFKYSVYLLLQLQITVVNIICSTCEKSRYSYGIQPADHKNDPCCCIMYSFNDNHVVFCTCRLGWLVPIDILLQQERMVNQPFKGYNTDS